MTPQSATAARSCRLCDESNDKMFSIFEAGELNIQIIKMIQDCLPILIYEDDPLSKEICYSCNETLNMFCEFKKTCMDIAKKHRHDLEQEGTAEKNTAIKKYLTKIKDFEESDSFNEEQNGELDATSNAEGRNEINESTTDAEDSCSQNGLEAHCNKECDDVIQPKPRISGPKSQTNSYRKVVKAEEVIKQPLTLVELVVQCINIQNIPEFASRYSKEAVVSEERLKYSCRYCEKLFEEEAELALHELEAHIRLHLVRVDKGPSWNASHDSNYGLRNKWVEQIDNESESADVDVEEYDDDGKDLLVPIDDSVKEEEEEPVLDVSRNSAVYFVGQEPYARGVPLKDLSKEVRNSCYQSVMMSGMKKKFCQLCRYTFKDNWSIDKHYLMDNCYYSCYYCGIRFKGKGFKRSYHDYPAHVAEHEAAGHKEATCVFVMNERCEVLEYDTSCLQARSAPSGTYSLPRQKAPLPQPTSMKLRVRQLPTESPPPTVTTPIPTFLQTYSNEDNKRVGIGMTSQDMVKNQAYFCKKCYQVFTKLGSYNTHISTCNGEIDDPEMSLIRPYTKKDGSSPLFSSKLKPQNKTRPNNTRKLPDLKPLPQSIIKIKQENGISVAPPPTENFPCNYCNSVFKTIYSRNSHMRIHVRNKQTNARTAAVKRPASPPKAFRAKQLKLESSFEPIVEIHEGATTTIGSVSITPIKKTFTSGVSPDVMKLVQNNPNITLKARTSNSSAAQPKTQHYQTARTPNTPTRSPPSGDDGRMVASYKCSSCCLPFANKSNLYFHKKNQCTGSRFPCPFCKKRFGTASEYSSHIYYSHPE